MKKLAASILICVISFPLMVVGQTTSINGMSPTQMDEAMKEAPVPPDHSKLGVNLAEDGEMPFDMFNYKIVSMPLNKPQHPPFWNVAEKSSPELILGVFNIVSSTVEEDAKRLLDISMIPVAENPAVITEGVAYLKYNLEGGSISVGDYVTISSDPGVGMKATEDGFVVGVALESSEATSKEGLLRIRVMVRYEKI